MIGRLRAASSLVLVIGVFLLTLAAPASGQQPERGTTLEEFVLNVAHLWGNGDVPALLELLPADNFVVLDTGSGIEKTDERHAAAALRALFANGESLDVRPIRIAVASTAPLRGFGELSWTFRARGSRSQQSRSVFVAAAMEEDAWRITELRLMPFSAGSP
ncbi:MAG: hypothetical protein LBG44_07720 [Gemmatimonadota bacterium]|jgi:hypothetical protein|nr:hypothetical protein [Gemmatimonadota bacterium]